MKIGDLVKTKKERIIGVIVELDIKGYSEYTVKVALHGNSRHLFPFFPRQLELLQ